MNDRFDTSLVVRSWLREGDHDSADHVLQKVLVLVDTTPQRRSWWPARRDNRMTRLTQYAIAAAAVLVVAIIGLSLLPGRASVGAPPTEAPNQTPTVSPTPEATQTPFPPPSGVAVLPAGSLAPGTYFSNDPTQTLVPYTFTVPAGWTGPEGASRGETFGEGKTGAMLTTWIITDVYGDGCNWPGTLVPVTDRASLVAALVAAKGHDHSSPVETTIGGLPATKIVLMLDSAFPIATCPVTIRGERLWPDPGPDESGGWMIFPGQTLTLYALESHGKAMVLFTVVHKDTPAADVTQLQQILDSVHFLPAG